MKLIITFAIILISVEGFAQDAQLFENDWYLQKVNIDGEDRFPPTSSTEPEIGRIFFLEAEGSAVISFCDIADPMIAYDPVESLFTLQDDPIVLVGDCIEPLNLDFSAVYFSIFYEPIVPLAKNPFSYSIAPGNNGTLLLTIENSEGNQAVYGNALLSNPSLEVSSFQIYPNPVKEELFITTATDLSMVEIRMFDSNGKLVLSEPDFGAHKNSIDVTALPNGIYFLSIEGPRGEVTMKKVVKW